MGVPTKPNYGRSYKLQQVYGSEQEVARVDLSSPRDMTIMLGDIASMFIIRGDPPYCVLTYGTGGVSNVTTIQPSVRGTVYHVVAAHIDVRAVLPQNELADVSGRFSANVGYGRPTRQSFAQNYQIPTDTGGTPPGVLEVRLLPWTTHIQVTTMQNAGGTPASVNVSYLGISELAIDGLGVPVPVEEFAGEPVPIPFHAANAVQVTNGGGSAVYVQVVQHWML